MRIAILSISLLLMTPNASIAGKTINVKHETMANGDLSDKKQAEVFLGYLLQNDQEKLLSYTQDPALYATDGKLHQQINDFLYLSRNGMRAVIDIARMGDLKTRLVYQPDNRITVIYVPSRYEAELSKEEFLQAEWMRKYFACEFYAHEGGWKLANNFCFAETDGPFHPEYG